VSVRSRRVLGPQQVLAGGTDATYTVPSGRTLVVRSLVVASNATAAGEFKWFVGAATTPTLIWVATVGAKATLVADWWMALDPGDVLRCKVVTGQQNVTVSVFGALLFGAPV
jgi:hypothetical protein